MITYSQIKQIHTLKSVLGLDDDLYRDMLSSFGVYTSKNLTETEAKVLIDILNRNVKKTKINSHKKYDDCYGRDDNMATPPQLRKIEAIWKDICNNKHPKHVKSTLRKYIKKQFHIDDIKFMTKIRASRIIAVLEKIKEKKFLKAL